MSMLPNLSSFTQIADGLVETISRGGEELKNRVMKISESARLVKNATNNLHWGPTGPQMRQIADLTFQYQECTQIMQALWERIAEGTAASYNWRNVYKALLLLDYLIKNGSETVVNDTRMNIHQLKGMMVVQYVDPDGVDRGVSIRERAKLTVDLLSDTNRLREERKKSKMNRDKYSTAYSSAQGWTKPTIGGNSGVDDLAEVEDEYFSGPSAGERTDTGKWDDDPDKWNDPDNDEVDNFQFRPGQGQVKESLPSVSTSTKTEWDPFGTGTKEDDWADWSALKEAPAQTNTWTSTPNPFSQSSSSPSLIGHPIQSPVVSMPPIVDLVGTAVTVVIPTPEPAPVPPASTISAPALLKPMPTGVPQAPTSPVKPNDPWAAHSHLFDLSLSSKQDGITPSPGKSLSTSGKPLGSTLGWSGMYTTPTGPPPATGYVVSATYPGYMTGYVAGGAYPPTGVYSPPAQTTAPWGI